MSILGPIHFLCPSCNRPSETKGSGMFLFHGRRRKLCRACADIRREAMRALIETSRAARKGMK